jgi:hypothetical protein
MLATELIYNMKLVINDRSFSQSPIRQLAYKPMPVLQGRNVAVQKIIKPQPEFSSLGFVIPFQPCMWDEKSVQSAWDNAMQIVETKMKGSYSEECTNKVLARLEKIFNRLNFNTHRKSLAVILTPDEEKLIYLSFLVRPVVFSGRSVSVIDLATNIQREPDFYYLVLNKDYAGLYDYNNKQLRKVYEQSNETCLVNIFKNAAAVIELLNSKNEKPVFVTGSPNLVEQFCNSEYYAENYFPLLYHKAPFSSEIIQSLVKEITNHWNYWQSKFIASRVLLAQKANALVSNAEAVLLALRKSTDGLLLIDKRLKQQLQKSARTGNAIFHIADELIGQIEKFLTRGNRIEITETGLLKDMGGIVLLHVNNNYLPTYRHSTAGGSLY